MQRSKISLFTSGHQKILVDISALSVAFRPFYWRIQVYVSIIYFKESESTTSINIYFALSVVQGDPDKFTFVLRNTKLIQV